MRLPCWGQTNGDVFTSEALHPSTDLVFPPYSAGCSFGLLDTPDSPSERDLLPKRGPYEWFLLHCQEPERIAPTGGCFVVMLEPKKNKDTGQPTSPGGFATPEK